MVARRCENYSLMLKTRTAIYTKEIQKKKKIYFACISFKENYVKKIITCKG